jgi:hypothetical protein
LLQHFPALQELRLGGTVQVTTTDLAAYLQGVTHPFVLKLEFSVLSSAGVRRLQARLDAGQLTGVELRYPWTDFEDEEEEDQQGSQSDTTSDVDV